MRCAKIVVKNNYEKRGDLVLRSYIRALRKINAGVFLDGDNAVIYGIVDNSGIFHELYTDEVIDYDNYLPVIAEELYRPLDMNEEKKALIKKIINKVLFGKNVDLDIEISTIEELSEDRAIEFDAYNNYLSRINPYQRLNTSNPDSLNDYNNFSRKLEEIKVMKELDRQRRDVDFYSVYDYVEDKKEEIAEPEYLIFEVPKVLVKKNKNN